LSKDHGIGQFACKSSQMALSTPSSAWNYRDRWCINHQEQSICVKKQISYSKCYFISSLQFLQCNHHVHGFGFDDSIVWLESSFGMIFQNFNMAR
jgi:hypothetical protein